MIRNFLAILFAASCAFGQQALTLEQAISEATSKNLDLAAARYDITVSQAGQIQAALRPNPVLSLSGEHLDVLGPRFNALNGAGPNEAAARVDFILERGKKRESRIDLATQDTTVAETSVENIRRRLIFDVQSAFVDVLLAKDAVALAQENLTSLNNVVAVNQSRVNSGDLAVVELNRSQVAALQYQTAVRQAELQLRQAKVRLALLMGRPATVTDFDAVGTQRRDESPLALDQIRQQAIAQRPDLRQRRQTQARNQADLRLQLAQRRIDYTVGTEYRRQQGVNGTGNSMGFFFSAPLPVFNKNQGEILRAQRSIDQAAAQVQALEAHIDNEVAAAWDQYSTAKTLLSDIEQSMLNKARDVRATTEYSYRRGEATLVEYLDAQRAFNDTMESYNEARASFARSLFLIDSVAAR